MNVADLEQGKPDSAGVIVDLIYARNPPKYAVYRTAQRVNVHFADEPATSDEQRKVLSQLAPIRGEINGLVDGWRHADLDKRVLIIGVKNGAKLRDRAERFDREVADALVVALEGDLTGAGALLNGIKDDAMGERVGWARFEYLVMAFVTTAVLAALALLIGGRSSSCDGVGSVLCIQDAPNLWRGDVAGAFGAFFSIALSIRGRTILTDLYRTSNLMDAVLRIIIGALAGTVLVALIIAGFVKFHLGDSVANAYGPLEVLIFGFVAGFAERLVPDLLAKVDARTGEPPTIRKPEPELPTGPSPGPAGGTGGGGQPPPDDGPDPIPAQADEDACIADVQISDDEATPDSALPAASGGVEADLSSEEEPK